MWKHTGTHTRSYISRIPTPIPRERGYSSLNRSKRNAYMQTESCDADRRKDRIPEYLTTDNQQDSEFVANDVQLSSVDELENLRLTAVSHSNPSSKKGGIAFFVDASNSKSIQNTENTQTQRMVSKPHNRYTNTGRRENSVIQRPDVSTQEINYFPSTQYNNSSTFTSGAFFLRKIVEQERRKRIKAEMLIQQLQNRLLEYEEKLVIACRNLRQKDVALYQLQNDRSNVVPPWRRLEQRVRDLQEKKKELMSELREVIRENRFAESDLHKTYTQVCNLQEEKTSQECSETENANTKTRKFERDPSSFPENEEGSKLEENMGNSESGKHTLNEEAPKQLQEEHEGKERTFYEKVERLLEQREKKESKTHNSRKYQIEIITKNKLKQNTGYNKASLEKEVKKREQEIIEISASHVKQLAEKHDIELKLLEEKHKEELRMRDLKLCESLHAISVLESKLRKHKEQNTAVLKKLKKYVEKQFNCAINVMKDNVEIPMTSLPTYNEESFGCHSLGVRRSNSDTQLYRVPQRL